MQVAEYCPRLTMGVATFRKADSKRIQRPTFRFKKGSTFCCKNVCGDRQLRSEEPQAFSLPNLGSSVVFVLYLKIPASCDLGAGPFQEVNRRKVFDELMHGYRIILGELFLALVHQVNHSTERVPTFHPG